MSVSACGTSTQGSDFCLRYTLETPKSPVFSYVEENDPVWAEQVYANWAEHESCGG